MGYKNIMLSVNNLSLQIEGRFLFKNLSFTCLPASILYICGNNGSGKTSLLRIIAALQKSYAGEITIGKKSMNINNLIPPYVTYIGHHFGIKMDLTVEENIGFWASFHDTEMLINAAISYLFLEEILHKKCRYLSLGNQKLVAMARLILCPSKIWLLDELDASLDENYREILANLSATHINSGGIILFATHDINAAKNAQVINLNDFAVI
jgi:heme exporter protein A